MKGSMRQRAPGRWQLRVYLGRDPVTGKDRYRTESFEGSKRQAQSALARLVAEVDAGIVSATFPTVGLRGLGLEQGGKAMHARVSTYGGTPEQAEAGIRNFEGLTDALRKLEGFEAGYLLADRTTGKAMTITLWRTAEAAQASAEQAKQMRSDAAGGAGMSIESVETYEVAVHIQPGS